MKNAVASNLLATVHDFWIQQHVADRHH